MTRICPLILVRDGSKSETHRFASACGSWSCYSWVNSVLKPKHAKAPGERKAEGQRQSGPIQINS